MPDHDQSSAELPNREGVSRRNNSFSRSLRYWIGVIFTLVGDALVIASLFSPWVEIFKNDPTYLVPRQGYSPWLVLQRGYIDALGALSGAYFLVALGLLIATVVLARTRSAKTRSGVGFAVVLLAISSLFLVSIVLAETSMTSFSYPYYNHNLLYGGSLAVIGLVSVLVGAILLAGARQTGAAHDSTAT